MSALTSKGYITIQLYVTIYNNMYVYLTNLIASYDKQVYKWRKNSGYQLL